MSPRWGHGSSSLYTKESRERTRKKSDAIARTSHKIFFKSGMVEDGGDRNLFTPSHGWGNEK